MMLKSALTTNGVFSGLTGIASVVAAGPLANLLGVAATGLLVFLGIGLIGQPFQHGHLWAMSLAVDTCCPF